MALAGPRLPSHTRDRFTDSEVHPFHAAQTPQLARAPCFRHDRLNQGRGEAGQDRRGGGQGEARQIAGMESRRSLSGAGVAEAQGRPRNLRAGGRRHAGALCRQACRAARRRQGRRASRASRARVRGAERRARPHRLLCQPALRGRHLGPQAAEILRRHPGEDHRDLLQAAVLPARAQPARRRDARDGDGQVRARPLPALARGSAQGEALSARGQARAAVPREGGDGARRLGPAVQRDDDVAADSRPTERSSASSRR